MLDHDSTWFLQTPARCAMSDHVQLDLPIVLPNVPGAEDACVDRLTASLREQEGVSEAHVTAATNGEPDRLCIHYDPEAISLPRIRQRAQSLGTELTDQYGHLSWAVRGISHPRRAPYHRPAPAADRRDRGGGGERGRADPGGVRPGDDE